VNRWAFVIAAYAIALAGTLALVLWSYVAMRRAERAAEALRARE
jgi:Flp pilus assembly protein CpaB